MFSSEVISSALIALKANKARTALTMLGVVIGVFAVIALVSVVKGVENNITGQFNSLGSNLIIIAPGRAKFNQDPAISFTNNKFETKHIDIIKSNTKDYLVGVIPSIRVGKTVEYKTKSFFAGLVGTTADATKIVNIKIAKGRFFNQLEEKAEGRVAVISNQVQKSLFENEEPLGKEIQIDSKTFTVIGVLDKQGFGNDERIYLPYTTVKSVLGLSKISGLSAKVKDGVNQDEAIKQIASALLTDLKSDDFTILTLKDVSNSIQSILNIIGIGLAAVAGISLFVGGIGIMNIMLVSVNERIREIGLRKALGATSFNIGLQFLLESLIISTGGGMIGMLLGFLLTLVLKRFFPAEVPIWTLILSFSFSLIVGLLFGTYPAVKASKKDPIEALRYE